MIIVKFQRYFNRQNGNKYFSILNLNKKQQSYYEILEINQESSFQDIKKAYFEKAKQYHPDLNPDNKNHEEKFKQIVKAYENLKDPAKRQMYDLSQVNPHFSSDATSENYQKYHEDMVQQGDKYKKKYYENKWYNYKKPDYSANQRDEYYQDSIKFTQTQKENIIRMFQRIGIVLTIWLFFDLYNFVIQSKRQNQLKIKKEIYYQGNSQSSVAIQDTQGVVMNVQDYIQLRQEEQDDTVFYNKQKN